MKIRLQIFTLITITSCLFACHKEKKQVDPSAKNNQGSFALMLQNKPTQDDIDLINEAKQGNVRRVKSIISTGRGGIYSANENNQSALMIAAQTNNRDEADYILSKAEDGDKNLLDRGDNDGKTAMIYAAENKAAEIILDLRKKLADPNVYDHDKDTPLIIAAEKNDLNSVNAILKPIDGAILANPDLKNASGATAVLKAAIGGNQEMIRALKDYGANINEADLVGINPLAYAASKNNKQLFDFILSLGANINYLIGDQKTILTYAIEGGNNDMAKYLLDKGADPNIHAEVLATPLQLLVSKENVDPAMVEYLITKGAKLNGPDMQSGNVISWSIHKGNAPAIQKLIEKGAKVADLESANDSGVLMAANIGDPAIAELMIANGSDPAKPNAEGFYPLSLAAKNNYQDMFQALIKKGADVNAASRNKYATPLEIVFANGNSDLLKIMFDNGLKVSPDAILLRAIDEKKDDLVTVALAYGARPNIMNSSGQPAIWLATAKDDTKVVEALVDNSAMLDVQDNTKGIPPLSLAILRNNTELAKYLIEKGANPNLADKTGYTALTYAAVTGQDELVKMLIAHKASTNVTDSSGKSLTALIDSAKIRQEQKDAVKKIIAGK